MKIKYLLSLALLTFIVGCATRSVVTSSTDQSGNTVLTTNLVTTVGGITIDAPHTAQAIRNVAPPIINLVIQKYPQTADYFRGVDIVLKAALQNGNYDPNELALEVNNIAVQLDALNDPDAKATAIAAVQSAFGLYQAYAGNVATAKLNSVTWLPPVLSSLSQAIESVIPAQ